MSERPILFSAQMVRAILAGRKTQTRRVVKITNRTPGLAACLQPADPAWVRPNTAAELCPYGQPGDRLWVREAYMHEPADYCWEASVSIPFRPAFTVYRADYPESRPGEGWKPSIHMPRALSRISLEVTAVRVERLHDISAEDALAEGVNVHPDFHGKPPASTYSPVQAFRDVWETINGPEAWDANPWVWVVEFRRMQHE